MTPQLATLDPLDLANYGFSDADLDRPIYVGNWNMGGYLSQETRTLREVVNYMEKTYCRRTGYEYMHINDREICNWLRDKIEFDTVKPFPKGKKINTLDRLTWSTEFEAFLASPWATHRGLRPVRTELCVAYRMGGRVVSAGQVDALFMDKDGLY